MIVRSANRQVRSDGVQVTEKVRRWLVRKLLIKMMMCSHAADDVRFDKTAADAQAAFLQRYLILQKKTACRDYSRSVRHRLRGRLVMNVRQTRIPHTFPSQHHAL